MNIIEILNKEFIGKPIRVCTYYNRLHEMRIVFVKKNGATNKHYALNPQKYGEPRNKIVNLGSHRKFEDTKIKEIYCDGNYFDSYSFHAILENGLTISIDPYKWDTVYN